MLSGLTCRPCTTLASRHVTGAEAAVKKWRGLMISLLLHEPTRAIRACTSMNCYTGAYELFLFGGGG